EPGAAATVDRLADGTPGVTVTVGVWVTATVPFTVAEMTFAPATVELSVPIATPLALVTATGCVSVLPLPVAANATVAPWIGLLNASRTVAVMVVDPPSEEIDPGAT